MSSLSALVFFVFVFFQNEAMSLSVIIALTLVSGPQLPASARCDTTGSRGCRRGAEKSMARWTWTEGGTKYRGWRRDGMEGSGGQSNNNTLA